MVESNDNNCQSLNTLLLTFMEPPFSSACSVAPRAGWWNVAHTNNAAGSTHPAARTSLRSVTGT